MKFFSTSWFFLSKSCEEQKLDIVTCILVSDYLEVVIILILFDFFKKISKFEKKSKHKTEVRTVLLELGIVLGILKKSYLNLAILF